MADPADRAQDLIEAHNEMSIKSRRQTLTVPFSGFCLCCGEPVEERRFCDSDCREEYEQNQLRRMRSGGFSRK